LDALHLGMCPFNLVSKFDERPFVEALSGNRAGDGCFRQRLLQGVNLPLYPLNGILDLPDGERVDRGHAEMGVHLRPGAGIVNRGHAYPCVDDGGQGLAFGVGTAGRAQRR